MAEIVNLRLARKRKQRDTRAHDAAANRAKHGRTKAQRSQDADTERRRQARLDGAKRETE